MERLPRVFAAASERLARKRGLHELTRRMASEKTLRLLDAERLPMRVGRLLQTPLAEKALRESGVAAEMKGMSDVTSLSEKAQGALERIIDGADFFPAWFLSRGAEVRGTVARVRARTPEGRESMGTGFLVGPRLLLTNFHVLDWTDLGGPPLGEIVRRSLIELDYEERFDGTMTPLSTFGIDPDTLLLFSPWTRLDYALVALEPVSREGDRRPEEWGHNRLTADLGKIVKGEPVYLIQHPRGQPKQVVFRNNLLIDRDEDEDAPYLTYEADTDQGSSGAPVFNRQWEVVALHHSTEIERDDQGRILARDGSLWQPGDDVGTVKFGDLNEGIRTSRIVNDLEKKLGIIREKGGAEPGSGERCSGEGVRLLEAALRTSHGVRPTELVPRPGEPAAPPPPAPRRRGLFPPPD